MGLDDAKDSKYAISKLLGEKKVKEIFPNTTILKPSVVYSVDDNFTTTFMTLLSRLPFFPLYYDGNTKFMPINLKVKRMSQPKVKMKLLTSIKKVSQLNLRI